MSVSEPTIEFINGAKYYSWTVTQTDVSAEDFEEIEDVPTFCTLTLYEMDANGIDNQYALGLTNPFTPGDNLDTVIEGTVARAFVRNQCNVNATVAANTIVVRSVPASQTTVVTRITVREGHR